MPKDYRVPGNVVYNSGFCGCDDRMAILRSEVVPRKLDEIEEIEGEDLTDNSYVYVDNGGKDGKINLGNVMYPDHVYPDWDAEIDSEGNVPIDYIFNKPDISDIILDESFTVTNGIGRAYNGKIYGKGTTLLYIIKDMLTAINDSDIQTIYFGSKFKSIPESRDEFPDKFSRSADQLLENGFLTTFTAKMDYAILAIPVVMSGNKSIRVKEIVNQVTGGRINYDEGLVESQTVDGWKMYYLAKPVTGTFEFYYTFEEVR